MNQWQKEIGAVGAGLLVFFIIWGALGWYWYAAALVGAMAMGAAYTVIPKPRLPHAENELTEEDLAVSLAEARDKLNKIRGQMGKIKRPKMTASLETILKKADDCIRYARSRKTADSTSIGLLKTILELTEIGAMRAANVSGSSADQAEADLSDFEEKSLRELNDAMDTINNALVSGELLSFRMVMESISGTVAREQLDKRDFNPLPQKRSRDS